MKVIEIECCMDCPYCQLTNALDYYCNYRDPFLIGCDICEEISHECKLPVKLESIKKGGKRHDK